MRVLFISTISFACVAWPLNAMDFGPQDEVDSLNVPSTPEDESAMSGEVDASAEADEDQPDIRVTRSHSFGLRLGEAIPHAASGLVWQSTQNDQAAYSLSLSRGEFRSAEQNEGEAWFENRAKTLAVSGRYLWWPNSNFPFAFSAGLAIESASGTVMSKTGDRGKYRAETAYLSSSLVMSHIFSSGLWLEWTLISFNYGKTIKGSYESTSGSQMERIRNNLEGLKILGFANITAGYAW